MATIVISNNSGADFTGSESAPLRHNQANGAGNDLLCYSYPAADNGDFIQRFTGLNATNIPATITAATLSFWQGSADAGTRTIDIFKCLRAWVAAQAYAIEWATGQGWTTELARGAATDYDSTVLGTVAVNPATVGYIDFVLNATGIALVEAWRSGSVVNNGFVIARTSAIFNSGDSTTNTYFSEGTGSSSQKPKLTVTTGAAAGQVSSRNGIALSTISAINGITKSGVSAINGLTI